MAKHKKTYLDFFGYGEQDFIPCEVCGSSAADVHHIDYSSRGGDDSIENLMGLCRRCHDLAHMEELSVEDLRTLHLGFVDSFTKTP